MDAIDNLYQEWREVEMADLDSVHLKQERLKLYQRRFGGMLDELTRLRIDNKRMTEALSLIADMVSDCYPAAYKVAVNALHPAEEERN